MPTPSIPSFFYPSHGETDFNSNSSCPGKCIHTISGVKVQARAKWWPSHSTIGTVVVFVPGNPGVIEFYDSFLDALHLRYKERGLAIIAHGMLGHAPQLTTPKLTGLLHQVESLIQLLKKIKQEWSKVRVVAISHSVGAWVVMQSLKAGADIDATFGLFPTLSNLALTPRGRQISWLFQKPFPYIIILWSIMLRPFVPLLIRLLFQAWPQQQRDVLISIAQSPGVILSCLTMAREEMEMIKSPDEHFLKHHSSKFWLYYGTQDNWVGEEREKIINILEDLGELKIVHCKHGIPHDYCILHGELLAAQCGIWLENERWV